MLIIGLVKKNVPHFFSRPLAAAHRHETLCGANTAPVPVPVLKHNTAPRLSRDNFNLAIARRTRRLNG